MENEAAYTVHLDMPREQVWEKLRDFTLAPNYVPGITGVEITTENKEGVGASRTVLPKKMDETVIEWNDGYGFVLRLHNGEKGAPAPFKEAGFRYKIEDDGERTKFTAGLLYTMGMGWFGRLIERMFLGKIFVIVVRDIAISLKHFYETNEPVTSAILKRLKKSNH